MCECFDCAGLCFIPTIGGQKMFLTTPCGTSEAKFHFSREPVIVLIYLFGNQYVDWFDPCSRYGEAEPPTEVGLPDGESEPPTEGRGLPALANCPAKVPKCPAKNGATIFDTSRAMELGTATAILSLVRRSLHTHKAMQKWVAHCSVAQHIPSNQVVVMISHPSPPPPPVPIANFRIRPTFLGSVL